LAIVVARRSSKVLCGKLEKTGRKKKSIQGKNKKRIQERRERVSEQPSSTAEIR
jgi:hypothetical protein